MSKFYTYNQNNSGGFFEKDSDVREYVVIEANSADEANSRAEEIGLYFNGCDIGEDCSCCGDRWIEAYEDEGHEIPLLYSNSPMSNVTKSMFREGYIIHYLDGTKEEIEFLNK